jgi:hypothetical protein
MSVAAFLFMLGTLAAFFGALMYVLMTRTRRVPAGQEDRPLQLVRRAGVVAALAAIILLSASGVLVLLR